MKVAASRRGSRAARGSEEEGRVEVGLTVIEEGFASFDVLGEQRPVEQSSGAVDIDIRECSSGDAGP